MGERGKLYGRQAPHGYIAGSAPERGKQGWVLPDYAAER